MGDTNAAQGPSYGPYQISERYWIDATEYDPTLKENGKSWENVRGPGSNEYSEQVMQGYSNRYATEDRLGHIPTNEDIARIHNGGPDGYKKECTEKYYKKVESHLNNNQNREEYTEPFFGCPGTNETASTCNGDDNGNGAMTTATSVTTIICVFLALALLSIMQ